MILQVNHVSKTLGNFRLEDVTFSLPKGYIMGLIGPNGAGKTSLLHLILGLYRPQQGEIWIDGMNYETSEKAIKEMIGTVLAEELFDGKFTLEQNSDYYGKYYEKYDKRVMMMYLQRFGLQPEQKYKKLSKGEKLKFSFAFALAHAPRLLLLDEPTGNFDPTFRKEFFNILKEFISDGTKSVVLATHLTEDLDRIADYITYIEKGKLLFSDDIETIRDSYKLVMGEPYKIKLLGEDVIHMEEREFGTKALVKNHGYRQYDESLAVTTPTMEELMYFMTKRRTKRGIRK